MNATLFTDYAWLRPRFPEMQRAVADGFIHTFIKTPDSRYRCLSNPGRFYTQDELAIEKINCSGATLYLIAAKDNSYTGTYHDYNSTY